MLKMIGLLIAYAVPCIVAAITWAKLTTATKRIAELEGIGSERHRIIVEMVALPAQGSDFETDARYDLFINGSRAGYARNPQQVKTEVVELLDIDMRAIAGFSPPSRRSA